MQIGKPSYKICPHCWKINQYHRGPFFIHYFGLTVWSDGETFEELPSRIKTKLQKCHSCNKFYWFEQKLGGMSSDDYEKAVKHYQYKYSKKSIVNLFFNRRNKRRLLYLRLKIIQSYNDAIREHPLNNSKSKKIIISESERRIFEENVKLLISLLNELKSNDHLLLSELHRYLGDFEKAKEEIDKVEDDNIKKQILGEIQAKNRDVITLNSH